MVLVAVTAWTRKRPIARNSCRRNVHIMWHIPIVVFMNDLVFSTLGERRELRMRRSWDRSISVSIWVLELALFGAIGMIELWMLRKPIRRLALLRLDDFDNVPIRMAWNAPSRGRISPRGAADPRNT